MNATCQGDLLVLAPTRRYWRCFADGEVVDVPVRAVWRQCPACERPITPEQWEFGRRKKRQVRSVIQVNIRDLGAWVTVESRPCAPTRRA